MQAIAPFSQTGVTAFPACSGQSHRQEKRSPKVHTSWVRTARRKDYQFDYLPIDRGGESKREVMLLIFNLDGKLVRDARVIYRVVDRRGKTRRAGGLFWEGGYVIDLGGVCSGNCRIEAEMVVDGHLLRDDFGISGELAC